MPREEPSNFNLRNIPPQVMLLLKKEAKSARISVNFLILKFIEQGVGYAPKGKRQIYHDLDYLAGTWSEKEAQSFENTIKAFEKIDEDLWK